MRSDQPNHNEPTSERHPIPGEESLLDQAAALTLRIIPRLGSVTVTGGVYEYHEGVGRVQRGADEPIQAPAHILLRIERDQAANGGAGRVPVWTWRDKRRLVSALLRDSDGHPTIVAVPYTGPSDIEHLVTFRVDQEARAAFLGESSEVSGAIAHRTVGMLRTMMTALGASPLRSATGIHEEFAPLHLRDRDVRDHVLSDQLAHIDPDLPLNIHDQRQFTAGVERLQHMLHLAETVVLQESAIVSAAVRAMFTEVQGRRPSGWQHWVRSTAGGTYAAGDGVPASLKVPVLAYRDRERRALHVVEPAPPTLPGNGELVTGWPVRALDAARLLTESGSIVAALTEEWNARHHTLAGRVSGVVHHLRR